MEQFTEFAGAGLLGLALIVFWRMFVEMRKDRDYWRERALDRAQVLDDTLDVAEQLVRPLKKVERVARRSRTKQADGQQETLEKVVDFLLKEREV